MTTTITKGQTVAQVLRSLRPFLPAGFEKLTERNRVGYVYKDRLTIEVFAVCTWDTTRKQKQGCHAVRVVVSADPEWRVGRYASGVRSSSHTPRKDGTFKFDSIGQRVQFALAEIERIKIARAEVAADKARADAEEKALRAQVEREVRKLGLKFRRSYETAPLEIDPSEDGDERASIRNNAKRVQVSLNGLTLEQTRKVLSLIAKF